MSHGVFALLLILRLSLEMPLRSVALVPYSTTIHRECERGLRTLERAGMEVWRHSPGVPIDRARCDLATAALDRGFDELIWIDPDISFSVQEVERLRGHGRSFVGGACPTHDGYDLAMRSDDSATEFKLGEGEALRDVRYVGAGFLYTQRVVYEDIRRLFSLPVCDTKFGARSVPYFLPMVVADGGPYWYLSAEYSFCERAHQASHSILVDTSIVLERVVEYTDS